LFSRAAFEAVIDNDTDEFSKLKDEGDASCRRQASEDLSDMELEAKAFELMPRFLPSTKMKVCYYSYIRTDLHGELAVYDGSDYQNRERKVRRKGRSYFSLRKAIST
jgi:hypothetical protein